METRNFLMIDTKEKHFDRVLKQLKKSYSAAIALFNEPLNLSKNLIMPGGDTDPDNRRKQYILIGLMTLPAAILLNAITASIAMARLVTTLVLAFILLPLSLIADRLAIKDDEIVAKELLPLAAQKNHSTQQIQNALTPESTVVYGPVNKNDMPKINNAATHESTRKICESNFNINALTATSVLTANSVRKSVSFADDAVDSVAYKFGIKAQ